MEIKELIHFYGLLEKLKCNTRHSWTTSKRQESVAEHSFLLAVLAFLVKDAFPEVDIHKVVLMCLFHDFGEAVTGDIPAFDKTDADESKEEEALAWLLHELPERQRKEFRAIFLEMKEGQTAEAKLYKGLDRMEAVMQHNEASIETWLPLEYELQLSYGEKDVDFSPYLQALKAQLNENSLRKITEHREKGR